MIITCSVEAADALERARINLVQAHLDAAEQLDPTVATGRKSSKKPSSEARALMPIPEDTMMNIPGPFAPDFGSSRRSL